MLGADVDADGSSGDSDVEGGGWRRQNLAPGGRFLVLHAAAGGGGNGDGQGRVVVSCSAKTWGLVTRGGTINNPLPPGPSKHYSNLMFNARSETAASKPTFGRLLSSGRSAVVAVDGFFEWRDTVELGGKKAKQPYFVYRRDGGPLLLAGLHTSVPTGITAAGDDGEGGRRGKETLDTFTILTTDASPKLAWLHTRMPVVLRDHEDARRWIESPGGRLLDEISTGATRGLLDDALAWHPVTRKLGSTSYRGDDCTEPVKLEEEKTRSVASFFGAKKSGPAGKSSSGTPKSEAVKVEGPSSASTDKRPGITVADDEAESTGRRKRRPVEGDAAADGNGPLAKSPQLKEGSKRKAATTAGRAGTLPSTEEGGAGGGGGGKITSFFSPRKRARGERG